MTEGACGLVPKSRQLAHVVGDLGANRLRSLPRLATRVRIVASAEDPLDLGVLDLDSADTPAVAREAQVDRRLELDDPRAQIVRQLMPEHEVAQEIESSAGLTVRSGSSRRLDCREELTVGQCIRPRELGARSSVGVLLGRGDLRLPPREVRRERERSEPGLGLVEDRERVPHRGAILPVLIASLLLPWKSTTSRPTIAIAQRR